MTETIARAELLHPPIRRTDLKNITSIWIGTVFTQTGDDERVWIRKLSAPELLVECYCTVLGRKYGLPIPKPFLIHDPKYLISKPGDLPLFGSQDAEHPSFRQRIEDLNQKAVMDDLMRWPALRSCGCFDEHIANPDRNMGNLLFDGDNEWVAIDQAFALGGPARWPNNKLSPCECIVNQILNHILNESPELEGRRLPLLANQHATEWAVTGWADVLNQETVDLIDHHHLYRDVVHFMEERLPQLPGLVQHRAQQFSPNKVLQL